MNMSPNEYGSIVSRLAAQMKARCAREQKQKITDQEELDSLYFECKIRGEPYYKSDGQFTGGFFCERFDFPFDSSRKIQFDFDDQGNIVEAVTWIPYEDYPYPF